MRKLISGRAGRFGGASILACVISTFFAGGLQPVSAQQAAAKASAIIILDGSNSMNARLPNDKVFKHVAVREALRASLPGLTAGTEIGLAAFGARRQSDCNDAELMVPPSPDASRVMGALERFQPRGFSPVVLAMRTAAKALPQGGEKAGIILVLDDLASCRGEDPCVVAGELKRQNPALAIHIVGLGLKRPDAQVLACIARQTGGQLFDVADGPGVGPAMVEALQLVGAEKAVAAPVAASRPAAAAAVRVLRAPDKVAEAEPVLIDETLPGVHLTARLADGKPLLSVPVRWRVFKARDEAEPAADADAQPAGKAAEVPEPVFDVNAAAVSERLPDGRYVVEATSGLVSVRRPFEVAGQGPTRVPVVLDAALLRIAARHVASGETVKDAVLTVTGGGETRDQRLVPLWVVRGGQMLLVVPPGAYRINAQAGLAVAERAVAIGAGLVTDVDIELATGRLVAEETGGAPAGTSGPPQFVVEADDPDSSGGRRELYRATVSRLDIAMPAGTYLVTMRRGDARVRERFVVRAGEAVSRGMSLAVARVRLVGRMGGGVPTGIDVVYRIERLEGASRVVQRWGESEPVIDLTPGRYRFEARIGRQNATAFREAEVKGGFEHRVELDTVAAGVQLKLPAAKAGLGLGDVYWQIIDERGETVWRTVDAEPMVALKAGRYRVRAEVKDREFERAIDVRAGETRTIEVGE